MLVNVVCVRVGTKYGPEYVTNLFDMVVRNLSTHYGEIRFWCITDDPDSLPEGINHIPQDPDLPGWWQKIALFSPANPWEIGERVVYFDLDVAITGRLEDLVGTKGIIDDWHWPCFNSSVMVWDHGEHAIVWDAFDYDTMTAKGPLSHLKIYPKGQINGGDQEWITAIDGENWTPFPAEWCKSYRESRVWPQEHCKVVVFHGEEKPDTAGGWVADVWKVGGLTSLPEMKGANTSPEQMLANVAENIKLDVEWFTGAPEHSKTLVLVCGGPSMRNNLKAIKAHKQRGAKIATVNNAMRFLLENGIKPDHHIILDARPENLAFLDDAPEGVRYFLASQCDPSLFAALLKSKGKYDVILWHNSVGDGSAIEELTQDIDKPTVCVPGGCTVGLRALWLAWGSGYRKVHVYGMDSSYEEDGQHHAYAQPINDADSHIYVQMAGKTYRCAPWMARQANDFQKSWGELKRCGMKLFVHGTGLIPDMAKHLKEAAGE